MKANRNQFKPAIILTFSLVITTSILAYNSIKNETREMSSCINIGHASTNSDQLKMLNPMQAIAVKFFKF